MRWQKWHSELYTADIPHSFYGLQFGARMAVVILPGKKLWLYSPIPPTPALRAELEKLGSVSEIIAPNLYHHLYAGECKKAFPGARLHVAAGLSRKRKDLAFDSEVTSAAEQLWPKQLEHLKIEGMPILNEVVFLHKPSKSLICCDLLQNMQNPKGFMTRTYFQLSGIVGKPGLSRALRLGVRDKRLTRESIDRVLSWNFDRVVMAHGEVLEHDTHKALADAYSWLG